MRQVIVYRTEAGHWFAECPSLPGCRCKADTKPDAIDAIRQAIDEYIAELKQHAAPIPPDTVEVAVVIV